MCEKGKEVWELQEKVKYMTKSGWPLQTVKKWDVWEIVREVSDKVRSLRIIEMSGKIWEKHEKLDVCGKVICVRNIHICEKKWEKCDKTKMC